MTKVLIIGASGQIARHVVESLSKESGFKTTLFLRDARKLSALATSGMRVVEGDVSDAKTLRAAMAGQDIVYRTVRINVRYRDLAVVI